MTKIMKILMNKKKISRNKIKFMIETHKKNSNYLLKNKIIQFLFI